MRRGKPAAAVRIEAYTHPAEPSTQEPDTAVGSYYVSIVDGPKWGLLAGPFSQHADAIAMVSAARAEAMQANCQQAVWAHFGTLRLPIVFVKPGQLNDRLGLPADVSTACSCVSEEK